MATRLGGRRLGALGSLVLAAALLVVAAQVSTAQEAPATSPPDVLSARGEVGATADPVPGGPGFYSLHALAFRPLRHNAIYGYSDGLYVGEQTGSLFTAPVDLPHGARVTKLVLYFRDNDFERNIQASLSRLELALGGAGTDLAQVASEGSSPTVRVVESSAILTPQVDRQKYAYLVEVALPGSNMVSLIGARVDYSFDAYLPLTAKP